VGLRSTSTPASLFFPDVAAGTGRVKSEHLGLRLLVEVIVCACGFHFIQVRERARRLRASRETDISSLLMAGSPPHFLSFSSSS
jgi:hypothetical protein